MRCVGTIKSVCGSAVVPPFVVTGWLWSCHVWNTAELGA